MKTTRLRYLAFFMALNLLFETICPSLALALTNGPLQPEYQGFEPASSSEMVDLFTGDFKYNIPLMEVDGYPLNLSYHAGPGMETEASWVGLGWSMNPGVLNRMVKGLPDDFNGDQVNTETHIKPHVSMGVGFQSSAWFGGNLGFEIPGAGEDLGVTGGTQLGVDASLVLTYNNYKGFGVESQLDGSASLSGRAGPYGGFVGAGIGVSMSSQDGGTLSYQHSKGFSILGYSQSLGEGTSINTRTGAMTKTYFGNQSIGASGYSIGKTISHTLPSGSVAYSPRIANDYKGWGFGLSIKGGLWGCASAPIPSLNLEIKGGILIGFMGFYNRSELVSSTKSSNAYGYMYLENTNDRSLMDFNRFRDGAISEEVPNGPLANKTYDNYSAVAQGMASNFRPFRSDVGIVHDTYNTNNSSSENLSTEASGLLISHSLTDATQTTQKGTSGNWNTLTNNSVKFRNRDVTASADRFYEKAYFKQYGELSARNSTFDNGALGNESVVSPALLKIANGYEATNAGFSGITRSKRDIRSTHIGYLTAAQASEYGFNKTLSFYDTSRTTFGVNAGSRMVSPSSTGISRLTKNVPGDTSHGVSSHFSEITLTNTGGSRYVYGIPSYNLYKKRVMFNASSRKETAYLANGYPGTNYSQSQLNRSNTHQLVEYDPATDLSTNLRGADNLYQADETPAYASAYLLTTILSTDYVDVTGDGASYDDLGDFTKFNYSRVSDYKWREPYGAPAWVTTGTSGTQGSLTANPQNQAHFDKGLIADELDDKAFYEYGVRESHYLQSIETKNYVAFFTCSSRDDFRGVSNEEGAAGSSLAMKLDRITLYAKSDLIANGLAGATPVKTAHFRYDYSLCPNTFNSAATGTHGKLTLKKVFFTYGKSAKTALSPYEFYYGDNNHDGATDTFGNPEYNTKAVDRWGAFKPNSTNSGIAGDETPDVGVSGKLNNIEFPYSEQDESLSGQYALAWNLTRIVTPSGSNIDVTYEADDYSYIQNQQAGQMLMIRNSVINLNSGIDVTSYSPSNNLFDDNYLIIDLSALNTGIPANLPIGDANTLATTRMFKPRSDLYYKCFLKLGGPANSFGLKKNYYDYVPGYATIEKAGLYTSSISNNTYTKGGVSYYKYAYVKIKKENAYKTTDVNPISLAGWEYMRSFLPRVAYPGSEPANMGDDSHKPAKQLANALVGLGTAVVDFATGISGSANRRFHFRNFCQNMDYDKSFVRAYVPYMTKKGGGYRIKQILTSDAWADMTANTGTGNAERGSVYGQNFDYTTKGIDNTTIVSSGVASYEPLQGGDEISLRHPIRFEIRKKMAPNDHLFQEEPYGEMLYPGALVGYSKVTVTPLAEPGFSGLYRIGKSVFEFYTAKDYPIIATRSALNKELYQNDLIQEFTVVSEAYKIMHATQGHVLRFNDMHGKLKAINTYGEDDLNAPISGAKYTYKDMPYLNGSRQLVTTARTISEKNVIATEQLARDIDLTVDQRSNINESTTMGSSFFMEVSACSPYVALQSNVLYGYQQTGLKTAITTKIIQQYGILEKSEVFDTKSRTLSENLLWDRNTGSVVLSKTTNNLDQPVFSFNYPAYWMHRKMGAEFSRENLTFKIPSNGSVGSIWDRVTGTITKASLLSPVLLLDIGDEVVVYEASGPIINSKRYWVSFDYSSFVGFPGNHNFCLVDADGKILNTTTTPGLSLANDHYIKVIRPIDRNQLDESAGSVSSRYIPALTSTGFVINTGVISGSGQTWCNGWNAYLKDGLSAQQYNCLQPSYAATLSAGSADRFNPFTAGVLGRWRPNESFAFNSSRDYSNTQPDMKTDGLITGYVPFWNYWSAWSKSGSTKWVRTGKNTVYSPYGYNMERQDALGVYHSQRFGFNHTLPVLSASNAQVRQVGFESFEDYLNNYGAINSCNIISNDQLDFYNQVVLSGTAAPCITKATAHTGRTSLSFIASQALTLTHNIEKDPDTYPHDERLDPENMVCSNNPALNKLNFNTGKYIVSFWVKAAPALSYASAFTFGVTGLNGGGSPATISGSPKVSQVINGWQKFDYEFNVPFYSPNSIIQFKFLAAANFYLDDFRVQPFNSSMVCTVYDPEQMRVWAQLDDNNYATLMEYDAEGMLVRRKKETVKGLYTIQESRQSTAKRN